MLRLSSRGINEKEKRKEKKLFVSLASSSLELILKLCKFPARELDIIFHSPQSRGKSISRGGKKWKQEIN
jgi:hypothetical protein